MEESAQTPRILRFGVFEVNFRSGELRKHGLKIKLQEKPFQVLATLLEHPGNVVTREELRRKLWPDDTFVDFEHSINIALNKLRAALSDSAKNPRFVETLARHGYRFIAPVNKRKPANALAGKIRLVILPFKNLSNDPAQDYFSEGLTEEMITQIGRLQPRRLGVIARSTVMHYKDSDKRVAAIGEELGAHFILEGSVRRALDRVRISAQLIQVEDQTHLWAQTYDRQLVDVLDIQRDVAKRISRSLSVELLPAQQKALAHPSTRNSEAYEAYLRGRYFWNRRTEEAIGKALFYFEQAIEKDPGFALAYTGVADCYDTLGFYGGLPPEEAANRAETASLRALEIDQGLAEAHTSLAFARMLFKWDWEGAEQEFKLALDLNPNYVGGHHWYGLFLAMMGRFEEALALIKLALDLDPLSMVLNTHLGWVFYFARQFDRAVQQLRKALEMDPDFAVGHYFLGLVYLQKGLFPEAIVEFQTASDLVVYHQAPISGLGLAHGLAGRKVEARRCLEQLLQHSKKGYVAPYYVTCVWIGLGDTGQAFHWLEKAFEEHSSWMVPLKVDPIVDGLRSDPRFKNLIQRVGLPP